MFIKKLLFIILLPLMTLSFFGAFCLFDSENINNHTLKFILISLGCSIAVIYSPLQKVIQKLISIFNNSN